MDGESDMNVLRARWQCLALALAILPSTRTLGAEPGPANRLAKESSPYLRQHAHNPVDWFPWGPEAFEKAKKEDKLIFLSIGYSSCHWCHVMERESFSNKDVAKLLNDSFVCIKVDREERPDIDEIYMTALQMFDTDGGWPLSMFLTPDGKPIIGGTYWPPDDRQIQGQNVNGFKSILKIMTKARKENRQQLDEQADLIAKKTRDRLGQVARLKTPVALDPKLIPDALKEIGENFDDEYGGFGDPKRQFRGPKFPMPSSLEFILAESRRLKSDAPRRHLELTLEKMATGGMRDHLGGGFHRYCVERTWTVPHFEKMLYDNAQLAELYARAFEANPTPLYEQVIRTTLDFVKRELTSPEGVFWSALDADSEGEEGKYYVWTPHDLERTLTDKNDLALARQAYDITAGLNFENAASVLTRHADFTSLAKKFNLSPDQFAMKLEAVRKSLFDARSNRKRPFLDTKILTSWNGQMIAGFAIAGRVLRSPDYIRSAQRAAEFILKNMRTKEGRLFRTWSVVDGMGNARLNGYLDDYAFLIHGLLTLHEATRDRRWLEEATSLADTMIKWHLDKENGGFFFTSHDHEKLFARSKDQFDGAQPSGNSMAALDLVRLAKSTSEVKYRDVARKSLDTFAVGMVANPASLTTMLLALSEFLELPAVPEPSPAPQDQPRPGKAKKSDSVVKTMASAEKPDATGKQVVTVTLDIEMGWHLYANPVGEPDLKTNETTVKIAGKGNPKVINIDYPKGKTVKETVNDVDIEYSIYEGKVTIKATIQRAANDKEPLDVAVTLNACRGKSCLLPATVKLSVP
jgi:uncharacterized protein YyaL (SSP411 family)